MEDVVGLKDVWAVEIYNYGTVVECGEGYDSIFWDTMLRKEPISVALLPMTTTILRDFLTA